MLTKKRWISVCIVLILVLCCFVALPVDAQAESGTCGENLTWTLANGTLTISGTGDMYNFPATYAAPWFEQREEITSVQIDHGVTSVGDFAFFNCSISEMTVPGSVKTIGHTAFCENTSLKKLTLEDGVQVVGLHAFSLCRNLSAVTLPGSITRIDDLAFAVCPRLKDVYYLGTQDMWDAITIGTDNAPLTSAALHFPTAMGTCGDSLAWDLNGDTLRITGAGDMYDCTALYAPWFSYCDSIRNIEIGPWVSKIGDKAFQNCEIIEITIPGNIKSIGQCAFQNCSSLEVVTLKEGVQGIMANAFAQCGALETVHLPESVAIIEDNAFYDCPALKVVVHTVSPQQWETVSIGSGNDCLLKAAHEYISGTCGEYLTWSISQNTLTIEGEGAMYDYTQGGAPWYQSREKIQSIIIGENVSAIGNYAFEGCNVTTISMHHGVNRIGVSAFLSCEKLTEVSYFGAQLQWNKIDIGNSNAALWAATLKLPVSGQCGDDLAWFIEGHDLVISGTGDMYNYTAENKAPWSAYGDTIWDVVFEGGITSVGDYAFHELETLSFDFPKTITRIGHKITGRRYGTGHMWFRGTAPEIAEDAFEDAHIIAYVLYWDKEDMQSYGGGISWYNGTLVFNQTQNRLFAPDHVFTADDFELCARYYDSTNLDAYIPQQIDFPAYDNSTYGQKTVNLLVDGFEVPFTYFITDGKNHLDYVQVEFERCMELNLEKPDVTVTAGALELMKNIDYKVQFTGTDTVSANAKVIVTGYGNYRGFEKAFDLAVLKRNFGNRVDFTVDDADFCGVPTFPDMRIRIFGDYGTHEPTENEHAVIFENHINRGQATARVVGVGDYYGSIKETYQIEFTQNNEVYLDGAYMGQADGTLSGNYAYSEHIILPGEADFHLNTKTQQNPMAAFQLYKVDSQGNAVLIDSWQNSGPSIHAMYQYNKFESVYEDAYKEGGQWYMLSYAWVDETNATYGGAAMLYVPSKVWEAETMIIEALPDDGDFRREYFDAWSDNGNLGLISWSTSNSRIATVDDGVVTLLKPGTVTITGSYGGISASKTLTVEKSSLETAILVYYNQKTGKADVVYEGFRLEEGKDYTLSVTETESFVDVTIIGCGLFEGTIMRQFDTKYGESVGHTHVFSAVCDPSCETCDFVRDSVHTLAAGWKRDADGHWHVCTLCGEKQDYEVHTLTDPDTCGICGRLNLPGDMNNDYEVTDADAVYLLRHTLFEESYPITRNGDFNKDGNVTDADAIYLLRHTLFGDSYPIQ